MKTFQSYLTEGRAADLMGLLKTFGAGDIEITDDYMVTMLRKKQQVFDIVDRLPADTDYEVYVYEIHNDNGARELENPEGLDKSGLGDPDEDEYTVDEIGREDLTDQFHEYELVVYLYNAEVEEEAYEEDEERESEEEESESDVQDDEDKAQISMESVEGLTPEELEERKRIVKVNAKGMRRIKIKCKKGYKYTGNKCVKITGSELTTKRKAIKRSVRTKKAKGSGFQRKVQRLRGRAMRKRKSMGLSSSHVPEGNPIQEARKPSKKEAKAAWMHTYEQEVNNRKDKVMAGQIDWDTATHYFFKGVDAKTAAKTVSNPYKDKKSIR